MNTSRDDGQKGKEPSYMETPRDRNAQISNSKIIL